VKLAIVIESYIRHKQSLGMKFHSEAVCLHAFARAVGDRDLKRVDAATVRRFLDGERPITAYWFHKYYILKGFYRYCISLSYVSSSPLPLTLPAKPPAYQGYIYTNQDMKRLLDAADSCHHSTWQLSPSTVQTLLMLLYGTGLRIGEVLRLNRGDYDPTAAVITIHQTKFNKSRSVPIGPDLAGLVRTYIEQQSTDLHNADSSPFFATSKGGRIKIDTIERVFQHLREEAQLRSHPGQKYQPRLHDLRHTFAVVRLVTWYQEGKNVQRLLPRLSTYMGHAHLRETQRYITVTTELLKHASQCFESYSRQ
jgi:integrase/recombinase XerD